MNEFQSENEARFSTGFPSDKQWLALEKGFSRIFWGIFVSLVCFFGGVSVRFMGDFYLPAYVVGSVLLMSGLLALLRAGELQKGWKKRVQYTMFLVALQIYLAPFLEWWRGRPGELYFIAHIIILVFVVMLTLLSVNLIVAKIARVLSERSVFVEAVIYFIVTIVLQVVPFSIMLLSVMQANRIGHSGIVFYLGELPSMLPKWTYIMGMIPFSLNLMLVWRIREKCYTGFLR